MAPTNLRVRGNGAVVVVRERDSCAKGKGKMFYTFRVGRLFYG